MPFIIKSNPLTANTHLDQAKIFFDYLTNRKNNPIMSRDKRRNEDAECKVPIIPRREPQIS